MSQQVLNWFRDIAKLYEATAAETTVDLGPECATVFSGFTNDAIDISGALSDAYSLEELIHSLVYHDFHALHQRLVGMQFDFLAGRYEAVRRDLRFTWESIFRAYFVDRFHEMNSPIPNPPGSTIDEKAAWRPDGRCRLDWPTVILPVLRQLEPSWSVPDVEAEFKSVWDSLNAAVHPSSEWRASGVEESARHVWHHFDKAQARQVVNDARVVFGVVFTAILKHFPKIVETLAPNPHVFQECPTVRSFLPLTTPA